MVPANAWKSLFLLQMKEQRLEVSSDFLKSNTMEEVEIQLALLSVWLSSLPTLPERPSQQWHLEENGSRRDRGRGFRNVIQEEEGLRSEAGSFQLSILTLSQTPGSPCCHGGNPGNYPHLRLHSPWTS